MHSRSILHNPRPIKLSDWQWRNRVVRSNEAEACNRDPFHASNRFCQVAPRFRVSALTRVRLESGGDTLEALEKGMEYIVNEWQRDKMTRKKKTKVDEKDKDKEQRGREGATPRIERR